MLIQMITITDDTLITLGLEARSTLLKMCINLIIDSTILELTSILVF